MAVDLDEARMLLSRAEAHPELAFLINNTANFQPGTLAAHQIVSHGRIGQVRHVNTVLASPLTWLFEGAEHTPWTKPSGKMSGNGFAWGQMSHTFAWVFKVTGLTPKTVYAVTTASAVTGAHPYPHPHPHPHPHHD